MDRKFDGITEYGISRANAIIVPRKGANGDASQRAKFAVLKIASEQFRIESVPTPFDKFFEQFAEQQQK